MPGGPEEDVLGAFGITHSETPGGEDWALGKCWRNVGSKMEWCSVQFIHVRVFLYLDPTAVLKPCDVKICSSSSEQCHSLGCLVSVICFEQQAASVAACCPIQGACQIPVALLVAAFHPSRSLCCYHGHPLGT